MSVMALGVLIAIVWVRRIWAGQSFAPMRSIALDAGHLKVLLKQFFGRQGVGYLLFGIILLTMQADVLFLGWLGGAEIAGEYVVLWKAAEVAVLMLWRIPETLIPDLIRADVTGDEKRLSTSFWTAWRWSVGLSALGGVAYALLGSTVVGLWLGKAAVPTTPYAFELAGIALFFLGATHPAAIYAYATCQFRALLPVAGLELVIKLAILYWTYPILGYLAPLVGLIAANVAGVYLLYGRLAPKKAAA
jgi:O-antigen/teichoic acid export membrane protein